MTLKINSILIALCAAWRLYDPTFDLTLPLAAGLGTLSWELGSRGGRQ